MSDLNSSNWAPNARRNTSKYSFTNTSWNNTLHIPQSSPAPSDTRVGIEQYDKLLRRLEHKARLLFLTHDGATSASTPSQESSDTPTQFKLDFFEFYSLLERALVHLLSIFRISVARVGVDRNTLRDTTNRSSTPVNGAKENVPLQGMIIGNAKSASNHRFHMNMLQALDQPGPLHEVLGKGVVREDLGTAKDLRNRWKDAGEDAPGSRVTVPQLDGSWDATVPDIPSLQELNRMLTSISVGLLAARPLAEEEMKKGGEWEVSWRAVQKENGATMSYRDEDAMECDAPFEILSDEMELG